jgi:fucose 4-O-acetylase-like acetyltransferase
MRNEKIDFLRFIGLAMIILAHVSPPALIFQLRNFDVPLMVLVSGMSFGLAYRFEPYLSYLWKRVKRLVFPVWIFLTGYFLVLFLFWPVAEDLSFDKIYHSYFLISGIGYVWIIRVFLLVALLAPFIYLLDKRITSHAQYLFLLLGLFVLYEIGRYVSLPYISDGIGQDLSLIFFYIIPYGILFAFGLRVPRLEMKNHLILFFIFLFVFVALAAFFSVKSGGFVQTQSFKYPPSIYYFSYAIAVTLFLWMTADKLLKLLARWKVGLAVILFIAQNSIWVYLWHIPFVKVLSLDFYVEYFVVFVLAGCITFIQVWLVHHWLLSKLENVKAKKNIRMMLTG